MGPSICALCKKESETIDYLLINCSFTVEIWKKVCLSLKISQSWEGGNFDQCVFSGIKIVEFILLYQLSFLRKYGLLGILTSLRNIYRTQVLSVCKILSLEKEYTKRIEVVSKSIILKEIQFNGVVGYFD